jgi:hypothetical protein
MLIKQSDIKFQRQYDSLHFSFTHHCNTAKDVLENNCIHLKDKNTIIFLTENEVKKLDAIRDLLFENNLEQLRNINSMFTRKTRIEKTIEAFNKKCGWFFQNGNK